MPGTTTSGWPYVVPSDHPLEAPAAHSQVLANLLEARLKEAPEYKVRYRTLTGLATDANGFASISAAGLGLTTVVGAVASVAWGAVYDGQNAHFCTARVSSNVIQILCLGLTAATGANVNRMISKTGLTFYVVAWGT